MSPLNRGPLMDPRMPPVGMRPPLPPPPRFGRVPMPGMPPRMIPPPPPHSMGGMFRPMRPRMPPRLANIMRPGGPPPLFGARNRGPPPLMLPMMGPRGMGPQGPLMRPGLRGILPPHVLPHMRPRFPPAHSHIKSKAMNNSKRVSKLEELELKKPWMTDEIRSEIQKKNKLHTKVKKNKDAKEWDEFKDLRNKVTRMIRDAKNEYLAKNPEVAALYQDEPEYFDDRDENNAESEDEETYYYCEMCDREFPNEKLLDDHNQTHKVCGIDGCTFSAHPKLIEKHISMQHRTGLYHKLKNLSTPEEITKWIEERKRRYPTKSCIELKNAASCEKRERGEVIKKNESPMMPNGSKRQSQTRNHRAKRSRRLPEKKIDEQNDVKLYRGVRPFLGASKLGIENPCDVDVDIHPSNDEEMDEEPNRISDEEEEQLPISTPAPSHKSICSLVADYNSDMDDDAPEEIPVKRMKIEIESSESPSGEDKCTLLSDTTHSSNAIPASKPLTNIENESKSMKRMPKKDINTSSAMPNSRPQKDRKQQKRQMLLQRLLSRSIVHERNFICQCIKYIEDNNFFSSNQTTVTT